MDLTIPYTFYPTAMPGWIAWILFLTATVGATALGLLRGRAQGWLSGLVAGAAGLIALLAASMLASTVITFFLHDV